MPHLLRCLAACLYNSKHTSHNIQNSNEINIPHQQIVKTFHLLSQLHTGLDDEILLSNMQS